MVVIALALLLGGCSLVSGPEVRGAAPGPSGRPSAAALAVAEREVNEARDLINSYEGDTSVLIEASERIERALAVAPRYAPAYVQAARITRALGYLSGDEYDPVALAAALEQVDRAIALDPAYAPAYVLRGYIVLDQANPAEARRMAERAAKLAPDSPYPRILRAVIDRTEGHLEEARRRYVDLLSDAVGTPLERSLWRGLIAVYCGLEDYVACEAAHRRVIELDPESAWARGNYALFLGERGRWEEAIASARAALRIMDYPSGRRTLAYAHLGYAQRLCHLARWDEAIANAEAALRVEESPNGREMLAYAHVGKSWTFIVAARKGDAAALSSAIPHLNAAFQAIPDYPPAHFALGALHWEQARRAGDRAGRIEAMTRAATAMATAHELDPTSESYRTWAERAAIRLRQLEDAGATSPSPPR